MDTLPFPEVVIEMDRGLFGQIRSLLETQQSDAQLRVIIGSMLLRKLNPQCTDLHWVDMRQLGCRFTWPALLDGSEPGSGVVVTFKVGKDRLRCSGAEVVWSWKELMEELTQDNVPAHELTVRLENTQVQMHSARYGNSSTPPA